MSFYDTLPEEYWNLRKRPFTRRKEIKRLTEEERYQIAVEYPYFNQNKDIKAVHHLAYLYQVDRLTIKKVLFQFVNKTKV